MTRQPMSLMRPEVVQLVERAERGDGAAERGSATAQFNLGRCYVSGKGVGADRPSGLQWLRKAAQQGFKAAAELLEMLGESVGPDDTGPTAGKQRASKK